MSNSRNIDDIDLMHYIDGELDESSAREMEAHIAGDEIASRKSKAMEQMGEMLRTHLELAADDAEPRLDALWANIEHRIQHEAALTPRASAAPAPAAAEPSQGLWQSLVAWLGSHRGYFMTGTVAAGAAALIVILVRPPERVVIKDTVPTIVYQQPQGPKVPGTTPMQPVQQVVNAEPSAPEIEVLEVSEGTGSVFVIPGENKDDVSTTVIFVDMSNVEGPL